MFTDVTRRIKYQYPNRGIYHDLDSTLTGQGADTYATRGFMHNQQSECTLDTVLYDGVVCDPSVQVRRVAFTGYQPDHFRGMEMNVLKYDRTEMNLLSAAEKQTYIDTDSNYSKIFWKEKLKPSNSWAVPFVTSHHYRITWANDLDYTHMNVQLSDRWSADDGTILFTLPFVDAREAVNVTDTDTNTQIMEGTLV